MFSYISGKLVEKDLTYAVLDVNGIGFKIFTSQNTLENLTEFGVNTTLHTFMYIKEGIMDLYGFSTKEELLMFEMLISVSGVGAKAAIAILSVGSPSKIAIAVVTNDVKTIKSAQGIGPKIASRIILELKDKIKNEDIASGVEIDETIINTDEKGEAVNALMVLGYTKSQAQSAISKIDPLLTNLEDIIKAGLKALL